MCWPFGRRSPAAELEANPRCASEPLNCSQAPDVQAHYLVTFERDMALTASEFQRCLPGAFEPAPLTWHSVSDNSGDATVALASGQARLRWHALPPRTIALMKMHRVQVTFDFTGVQDDERQRVMKRFDLVMLRGGG